MHCNPAPPHPPPGEVYNVICLGRPYIDGVPVGYIVWGLIIVLLFITLLHRRAGNKPLNGGND